MNKPLSTIAKRRAVARRIGTIASDALGIPVCLRQSDIYPDKFTCRIENIETTRGPLKWLALEVGRRGVIVHTRFGFPAFAPSGANPHTGKWNHYIWPRRGDTSESYQAWVVEEVKLILARITLTHTTRAELDAMEQESGE